MEGREGDPPVDEEPRAEAEEGAEADTSSREEAEMRPIRYSFLYYRNPEL